MKNNQITVVFHYQALHQSKFFCKQHGGGSLPRAERFTETLVRLPLYPDLSDSDQEYISAKINEFSG